MYIQGGVYADIDTIDIKPISHWKEVFSGNSMNLVVGVVSDYNYEDWERFFNRRLVLSSSIFLVKSHHPMLAKLVSKIAYICLTQGKLIQGTDWKTALSEYDVNGDPVIQFTGPSILTDTFFEYMNGLKSVKLEIDEQDRIELENTEVVGPKVSDLFSYRNITGISRGVTVGDTMILPQISFNGFENSHEDEYDDNDLSTGYESLFYGRPLSLTEWSHRKVRFDST
ncbi:DEKNAAC103363 [Brettanomyces naardenensis]|uniref:DEKNAAC103363 n=1 Tax=Brettanomyces naardenensis TaxID=13370 RepID=A0A448YMY6_BRENA|nr:DEKNAAC103363 [Brettanomyces naardenensis]